MGAGAVLVTAVSVTATVAASVAVLEPIRTGADVGAIVVAVVGAGVSGVQTTCASTTRVRDRLIYRERVIRLFDSYTEQRRNSLPVVDHVVHSSSIQQKIIN